MKSILFILALIISSVSVAVAHNYVAPADTEKPAVTEQNAVEATAAKERQDAEKASLKMIDDLTEKVYLQRKKLWNKEAEEKGAISFK